MHDEDERHERPGDRDLELRAGRARVARHLRDAAEEPQVDAADLDPLAAGDERVAELVQDERDEEQEHRGDGDEVGLACRTRRARRWK